MEMRCRTTGKSRPTNVLNSPCCAKNRYERASADSVRKMYLP